MALKSAGRVPQGWPGGEARAWQDFR